MIGHIPARFLKSCVTLTVALILGIHSSSAQKSSLPPVRLRDGSSMYAAANTRQWIDSMQRNGWGNAPVQVIVQFWSRPNNEQRSALAKSGLELQDALPGNAFTATIKKGAANLDAEQLPVSVTAIKPSWKIIGIPVTTSTEQTTLLAGFLSGITEAEIQEIVSANSGKVLSSPLAANHFYEISLPANKITALASWYGVKSINPAAHDQALNFESVTATKTILAQLPVAAGGYGLLGDGMTIGVGDNTSGVNHVDLRDRIVNYNPAPYTNHGMHINGITGGAGTLLPRAQGFAPHATILDHLFNLVWARTGTMVQKHNMTVTNNSYAAVVGDCNYSGVYDGYAQALDTLALQYPNVLHVFASGNDGYMFCHPYDSSFGTVTGGYQPAKNVLVVAQVDKRYVLGVNSSRGPVKDGRLKPEITAIGTGVTSTRGGDNYLTAGGTSMACPQVSAAGLLLQQRYKQLRSNALAPSSLIKALLMNGAMDIGNTGPDFSFGFGMMDLNRSLAMMDSTHYTFDSVANGAQKQFTINVPPNTAQVKVMLYWHDVPSAAVAGSQLVNDLDLEVSSPAGVTTLPLVLDPSPTHVQALAVNGVDHLNNVEQVTLNTPAAGTYTVRVKGFDVTGSNQPYVVVYDYINTGVALAYPTQGATVDAADSLRIYWDASPDTRAFTLEISTDNGVNWSVINNNIDAYQRWYTWYPQGISSSLCRMRLTRNGAGQQYTSGVFVMNPGQSLALGAIQCPGYMNITWHPVSNATGYQVMRKKGPFLQSETVVTDTIYTFSGLSLDSTYYASVVPLINGTPGYRMIGISRIPNDGTCAGNISNGDLRADSLIAPATGRLLTTSQLGSSESIVLRVRNLDDAATNNYRISYSLNNGAWQSQVFTTNIPANSTALITIPAALNLSAAGAYNLRIAVKNLAMTDAVAINDTIKKTIRQLQNGAVNLTAGFTDGFESNGDIMIVQDSLGFTQDQRWDFYNSSDTGRLRTAVNSDIVINGNRSISMDVIQFAAPTTNLLTGTFNLGAYTTASSEVRTEFKYKLHGTPHYADSNKVWVRGSDALPWIHLFNYDLGAIPGNVNNSGTLSVTDALIAAGQNFSTSTQLRFGQRDTTVIALNNYGSGLTLDDVKMYLVVNDIGVDSIIAPRGASCNLSSSPVSISLYNGVAQMLNNIQVSYQLDNDPVVSAVIATLAGKTHLVYTFAQQLNNIAPGAHTIRTWATVSGDTYHANDTAIEVFHHQPLIATFPYLENFEQGDGYFFSEGFNNSWQYGTPTGSNVTNAASGTKAWKTNLAGYYNDNEQSYLYSPCYDLSGLAHPMLSFSGVLDIEDCGGTLCDAAWVEYTTNGGATWTKLGASGQGYGWYTNSTAQVWSRQGDTRWQVRSILLPTGIAQPIQFRFVLASDPGTSKNGIGVDDVHIFDRQYGIYSGTGAGPIMQNLSGTQFADFTDGGNLIAQIRPDGQNLGSTQVNVYAHNTVDTASGQYYLPRSFMVNSAQQPADSITARFYVLDAEVDSLVHATGCAQCTKPGDVYRLGISKYDDSVQAHENGTLSDNISGIWEFYSNKKVKWVPYDSGYYAELRIPSFSEFWFNDGGPQGNLSLPNYSLGKESLIAVYPNPNTDGQVNIVWSAGLEHSIEVTLTDIVGRVVKSVVVTSQNGKNRAILNAGSPSRGVYFIRCSIGDRQFIQKIVFQ